MSHGKNLLVLTDARYGELHKFRGWNKLVSVLDEPRLFARLFPELTKAEHQRLATWYAEQMKAMRTSWHQAIEHAEDKYGAYGPLISAGMRDHWPEATKNRIRKLAHSVTELSDAAQSHWRASGKRGSYVGRWRGAHDSPPNCTVRERPTVDRTEGGGGAKASPAARRHGLESYYSLSVPWEPNPAKRTAWHPTESTGPFKTLSRGAFKTVAEAHAWARKHLGAGAHYTIRKH
jgi:hypothetical protein